jgi:hypothetical protein
MSNAVSRLIFFVATVALLSGCAPMISGAMNTMVDENVVFERTAKYFGTTRKDITITSIEKGALSTTYQTRFEGKLYNCSIYYGEVTCKQPGT